MIECQICGRKLGNLTGKHLASHGMSAAEYKVQFPGHPVTMPRTQSEETKQKRAAKLRGQKRTDETKARIGIKHKGKKRSQAEIDKWRASYQEFLIENGGSPQRGMKRSEEFCARMSEIALSRDAELVQQKVDAMLAVRRGQKMTDAQKVNYSEARLKFIEENPDKIIPKLFNTKPEQEFEQILKDRGIEYHKNKRIGNRLFDFVIADCVVELDGPYHREVLMHGHKGMSMEERQQLLNVMQARDALKTQLAQDMGYKVFRIDVTNCLPKDWHSILIAQGWKIF